MFRCALSTVRLLQPFTMPYCNAVKILGTEKTYSTLSRNSLHLLSKPEPKTSLLRNQNVLNIANAITSVQTRTVTKFSLKKGKRKTVKAVIRRFFRLDWGGWIRPKVGRQKKLWKKTEANKRRLRQHVFCNATQSTLLDKMVTKYWKRPKYYVVDPYAPYHTREEFYSTRKQPIVYPKKI